MYTLYMDSGTSTTRAYLVKDAAPVDTESARVGTKDSALSGSNDILLRGMKDCCDRLLARSGLTMSDVADIWASGMVTNTFGIVEAEHVSTPVDAAKLLDTVYRHREDKYFHREINLIRGAKTAQPGQRVSLENIALMNNVRGEEIEAVGMVASNILPADMDCVLVSPGSHSHVLHVVQGKICDILSSFTGELNYAIREDTILGGELSGGPVEMEAAHVLRGYRNLERYGFTRAMYIIHTTKVFGICSDEIRSQLLEGVIAGSTVGVLRKRIQEDWSEVRKIVVIAGKAYMKAYEILCRHLMPDIDVVLYDGQGQMSLALRGFLEILRLFREKG